MRLIDERGRLFGWINIIDLLIVAIIVGGGSYYGVKRLQRGVPQAVAATEQQVQVTVRFQAVTDATARAIQVGDRFYHTQTNDFLGEVVATESRPSDILSVAPDGRFYETTSKQRIDLYVTISGRGRVAENGVLLGRSEVRIGSELPIKSRLASGKPYIVDIDFSE